jgi:hypothetical protein
MNLTRRDFGRICTAGLLFPAALRSALGSGTLTWEGRPLSGTGGERRYRADAQVVLFSIPVLHRTGVGDGSVAWHDSESAGRAVRLLEFTGRSLPQRAAGLNRLGFIRELSEQAAPAAPRSLYFGLMTSSPEESADEARKALHSKAAEASYSAIEGRIGEGSMETVSAHFMAPASLSSAENAELVERARQALSGVPKRTAPLAPPSDSVRPFLHALAELLIRPGEARYVYAGRFYRLRVERSADSKATALFRSRGLLRASAKALRIDGRLHREEGGKLTDFRLWIEKGSPRPLPLRIEFQPRSYLRLTFEAETA